jgi:carbon storage regulator
VVECLRAFHHVVFFCFPRLRAVATTRDEADGQWKRAIIHEHENGGSNMLVLSRKIQESVVVGGSVGFERVLKVTVLEINGVKVRLGFEIDKEVPVHRAEVWARICAGDPAPPGPTQARS